MERQVRERTAELEQANRAKDRFLAALSHELRTPLTPVRLALFSLQEQEQLSPPGCEAVAMIGRNLERQTTAGPANARAEPSA